MRIRDWSSGVCSSDLHRARADALHQRRHRGGVAEPRAVVHVVGAEGGADQLLEEIGLLVRALGRAEAGKALGAVRLIDLVEAAGSLLQRLLPGRLAEVRPGIHRIDRSEEHTSELQSLMRISYAVFCLKKKQETEEN